MEEAVTYQMSSLGKEALSGEGDDWTVRYSRDTAITMISFTLPKTWLSKQNVRIMPQVYANEIWCTDWS